MCNCNHKFHQLANDILKFFSGHHGWNHSDYRTKLTIVTVYGAPGRPSEP